MNVTWKFKKKIIKHYNYKYNNKFSKENDKRWKIARQQLNQKIL